MDDDGRRGRVAGVLLAGVLVLVPGCSSAQEPAVAEVATAFADAGTTPDARCALLVPSTAAALAEEASSTCAEAVTEVPTGTGPVESVAVWGGEAQVRLAGDTLFLTETPDGWQITAASCRAAGEGPYRCRVEGS
ncbi:MAG TPA: hypothetical protein VGO95_04995 [Modestobacter sp.]|nr:hypothetical protein [Modestobacter sp.]